MIVSLESSGFETLSLVRLEHTESTADFHVKSGYLAHHFQNALELGAIFDFSPSGTHAKPCGTIRFSGLCLGYDRLNTHQFLRDESGFVANTLGAVGAIFWTGTGLDVAEGTKLNGVWVVVFPVGALSLEEEIG